MKKNIKFFIFICFAMTSCQNDNKVDMSNEAGHILKLYDNFSKEFNNGNLKELLELLRRN